MYVLRQLGSTILPGNDASQAYSTDIRQQIVDVNPSYILEMAGNGKVSWGQQALAATTTLSIQLPQNYVTTNNLHVVFTSDQTVKFSTTGGVGSSSVLVVSGASQVGCLTQCGPVTAITITGNATQTANIEWFLFELPNILVNAGWRNGSITVGTAGP